MAKIQAEAARWGLEIEGEELACEACMAANTTFNVGGYSPVTMLFGVLPRGYLEPEEPLQGDDVSPDESAFERSLRLRQVAFKPAKPPSWSHESPEPTGPDLNDCLWKR